MDAVDLVWRQAFGGGSQVLRPNIPISEALTVLRDEAERARAGEYGIGAVVYLQPAGEHARHAVLTSFLDRAATDSDEQLGRVVWEVWRAGGRLTHPDTPWEVLLPEYREVYTRIGRTLFALGCAATVDRGEE